MDADVKRRALDRPVEEILRPATSWILPKAGRSLALYEMQLPADSRPRAAIEAAQRFAGGGLRGKELRTTAWAAQKASGESSDPALKFAARAALMTASVAYMHPDLIAATQLKHLYGPVVYTALALELAANEGAEVGDQVVADALSTATDSVQVLARSMPPFHIAKGRLSYLYNFLDVGLR